ncbi:MAG TPA: DUF72 domain-containing protein [Candidatus Saccharimonadales bacterium]|nr:DUF72 domain-containing protein [Candidatus Saccharimonadales bacterium]
MSGRILVGTASWTDPGFLADWYPKGLPARHRLSWYAEHFNMVEVNSSFYAIPDHRAVEKWCNQTPEGFIFDMKLPKLLSRHSTDIKLLPPELRNLARLKGKRVELTPVLEKAMTRKFLQEIEPMREHDKLGALLLQLSPGFRPRTNELKELDALFEMLKGNRIGVEFRNRDWVSDENHEQTLKYMRKHKLSMVSVDAPDTAHFTVMPGTDAVTNPRLGYVRLHGRNASGYVRGRTVAQRFNHQYTERELQEVAERVTTLAAATKEVHVVYNNNASDYAPKAAGRFQEIIAEEYPEFHLEMPQGTSSEFQKEEGKARSKREHVEVLMK